MSIELGFDVDRVNSLRVNCKLSQYRKKSFSNTFSLRE